MADKLHTDSQAKLESFYWDPMMQNSGDLESAARTITTAAEASGAGNTDYSSTLTVVTPPDPRLVIKGITARLAVTLDSITAGHLYCRVYVDIQDVDHRLFDLNWTGAGAKLSAQDTRTGIKTTIFNLLKDGLAHTFLFFFWVDTGSAVISLVQVWEGIGSSGTAPVYQAVELNFSGLCSVIAQVLVLGTGTPGIRLVVPGDDGGGNGWFPHAVAGGANGQIHTECLVCNHHCINISGTVNSDLNYLSPMYRTIRSEQ
jgi:hypothetical protein